MPLTLLLAAALAAIPEVAMALPPDGVPLATLVKEGERQWWRPDGSPRLLPLGPRHPGGAPIVFIHGIGGDPANQAILIREAQARGMDVYAMAYDSYGRGGSVNSVGFANELVALAATGLPEVTVVAHSLGALTFKAALIHLTDHEGHLQGFRRLRFVALGAPWGGVNAADLARWVFPSAAGLAFARDLAPTSDYWRTLVTTPLPPEVVFEDVSGGWDQFGPLTWGAEASERRATVLTQARRVFRLPRGTHHSGMWDARALRFVFEPDGAPDPASEPEPSTGPALWRELGAVLGVSRAFEADHQPPHPP